MSSYHKSTIIQQFNQVAATYDGAALLQKEIGNRLLERLEYIHISPFSILDLGCGTGYGSLQLRKKFPKANIVSLDISEGMITHFKNHLNTLNETKNINDINVLVADAEFLPIADFSFDLIFSNFALEWMSDLQGVLSELKRVLKVNGLFMFSTYGLDSLAELRNGIEQQDRQVEARQTETALKLPYFRDMHNMGDVMLDLSFQNPVMDVEWLSVTYQNVDDIIKDLCEAGVYPRTDLNPYLHLLKTDYEQYRQKIAQNTSIPSKDADNKPRPLGKLPVTYEIIYGHAWRKDQDEEQSVCAMSHGDVYKLKLHS